ncbi:amino acid ABC transporter permease [Billgrantia endophytica]|uniref:Putative glutamine transport system permease protein GlnP n=1 Tax=Billgrantia endophytica TaxID=2033802 RepID=A0A2N7TVV2_9GAMM|nr:amino acid ABC transporter permease [Halomonas endophytica]PMR72285.1 cystine transporter permease [Halomonas endophytica]
MTSFLNDLISTFPAFIRAAWMTLQITGISLALALVIGLVFALMKVSGIKALSVIYSGYVGIIRGTPLIVQIMWLYFGITQIVVLSAFWAGTIALAIHSGAYIAEIFRGCIQSVDRGQMEAAESLGMKRGLAMRRIILPQAFKRAIPPMGNQFIIGLKDSSLVAFIGITEIFSLSMDNAAVTFKQLEFYTIAGLYYLAMVALFTYLLSRLEDRLDTAK